MGSRAAPCDLKKALRVVGRKKSGTTVYETIVPQNQKICK
jgi:hypothetical protein